MKKMKFTSLLIVLIMLCTTFLPDTVAYAGGGDSGMVISKTANANSDGSYTITLEAYATGDTVISEVTKGIPADIVLVLDQSGSMKEHMGEVIFEPYTGVDAKNSNLYQKRDNGGERNLWYKLSDESYVSVSVSKTSTFDPLPSNLKNESTSEDCYYKHRDNLYQKVGEKFEKVVLEKSYNKNNHVYYYDYTFSDHYSVRSKGPSAVPQLGGIYSPLYIPAADDDSTVYTYTYTDANDVPHDIVVSTGIETPCNNMFYERTGTGPTRLEALQTAVRAFIDDVRADALSTYPFVSHCIAVVGFADNGYRDYLNTELFIGDRQCKYGSISDSDYAQAFKQPWRTDNYNELCQSIDALDSEGGTAISLGVELANTLFEKNRTHGSGPRKRVMIVFTDGVPGGTNVGDGYNSYEAMIAIGKASIAMNKNITVYAASVFPGSDPTSAGSGDENASLNQKVNWFMQHLSSNNGVPQDPSYYLSAGDDETLKNIFQKIAERIVEGGSATTLSSETVIKDVVTPAFTVPEAADVTLETYSCTGKTGDTFTWEKNTDALGARATVDNGEVSITGFDFAEHHVGTVTENGQVTYRGDKLVIKFNVARKPEFLGGNNVYTNESAGVYENALAEDPVLTFDRPMVNVPISAVNVTAEDRNVYLLSGLTAEQLQQGVKSVSVGNVSLDLSKADDVESPYGLEPWQTEYVDITVSYKDANGNTLNNLSDLREDTSYTVSVTVVPKSAYDSNVPGSEAVRQNSTVSSMVHVFTPELTFKDNEVWYGENAPKDYTEKNCVKTEWKHGETADTGSGVAMIGERPTLAFTYTPNANQIMDGRFNTKQDIPVKVDVKIGDFNGMQYCTFRHQACTEGSNCDWNESETPDGDPAFLLHVKTCQLTITKNGGEPGEPYVFTVLKDGEKYTEASITINDGETSGSVTIGELPVGKYTIQEDTSWSWRYKGRDYSYQDMSSMTEADLSSTHGGGTANCTNKDRLRYWLNGFSNVVPNIFDIQGGGE